MPDSLGADAAAAVGAAHAADLSRRQARIGTGASLSLPGALSLSLPWRLRGLTTSALEAVVLMFVFVLVARSSSDLSDSLLEASTGWCCLKALMAAISL